MTHKLLFDEPPLVVNLCLARTVGTNDAIVLQQIHYWVGINREAKRNFHDGYYWTYNTYKEWTKQFPFSTSTVWRAIKRLEKRGLLVSGVYNKMGMDRTKWYRINYDKLAEMPIKRPFGQSEEMHLVNLNTPLPETSLPENSRMYNGAFTKNDKCASPSLLKNLKPLFDYYFMWYKKRTGKPHPRLKKEQVARVAQQIKEFMDERGYDADDMKNVVDVHFEQYNLDTDWNINHWATDGILFFCQVRLAGTDHHEMAERGYI